MTLHPLKVHLQTFLSTPITQKCQILSCDTLVENERCDDEDERDNSKPQIISIANGIDPEPALSNSEPNIPLIYIICRPNMQLSLLPKNYINVILSRRHYQGP
jgi:hypothetical protein